MSEEKKIQHRTIEKMFENKDFKKLATNTLSFSNEPAPELVKIWEDVFESIKRANTNIRTVKHSIMLLFSSIAEVYYLHKDRETRQRQKQEMYQEWIDARKKLIKWNKEILEHLDDLPNDKKYKVANRIKYAETSKEIIDHKLQIKAHKRSMELRMFDVTKNEKLTFDMTAQLASKNEKLIILMKEFNINPKIADMNLGEIKTVTSLFKELNND